ncbi:hypothetical protein [Streptomyces sp. SID13726]|uniref:hypothetical protein n=1 Tax=Streptomyces sp. SID13726 TaxID=2706058 RepID=UPI0013BCCB7B|nr:hypothetical protein [Streptomyces sp. SID13726]NEB00007.1 hypothetical protein [Streptomyces sp. SID13726]
MEHTDPRPEQPKEPTYSRPPEQPDSGGDLPYPGRTDRPDGQGGQHDDRRGERLDWFRQRPEQPFTSRPDADPVHTVWHLSRYRFGSRRYAGRLDHALVLVTQQGTYRTFMPPKRPTSVWGCITVYEVDTDSHSFQLNVPLPSRIDSFEFEATADITWRVVDPELFVRSQEHDVPTLVTRRLLPVMRAAGRGHPIEASADAEEAVQRAVDATPQIGAAEGLEVGCSVRLRRDATERTHQDRLRTARHEQEAAEPEHRASALRAEYEAKRTASKIAFYEHHLARGGTAALALHLAVHPEDTTLVLQHLQTEQAELVKTQLHLIDQALDSKRLEDYQLAQPHQLIAERMTAILRATGVSPEGELPPAYPEPRESLPDNGP